MTFTVPDRRQLVERALADIDARLPGSDSRLFGSNLNVLGIMHAGAIDGLYRYLSWIKDQMFVQTCDEEQLAIRAAELRVLRKPASQAMGKVIFPAAPGSLVPDVSDLVRADGVRYQSVGEAAESGGQVTLTVRAMTAGEAGNAAASSPLSLLTPVAGVQSGGTVHADGIVGGADIEDIESWRDRILRRMSQAPQGGSRADYEAWALEVPGVTRVWVTANEQSDDPDVEMGPGTVTVRFVRDNDDPIIPETAECEAVQDYLEERRPVAAKGLFVVAPIPVPLNFEIQLTPASSAVRASVEAALRDLIRREAEPQGTILISHIREAISTALGEEDHVLVSPTANVEHGVGELAVMGDIVWS